MSSSFVYAREAIEEVVQSAPASFRRFANYQWSDVVPSDFPDAGPGFTAHEWQSVATDIVDAFNRNWSPHPAITVNANKKAAAHGKRLVEFQIFLSAKADGAVAQSIVDAF